MWSGGWSGVECSAVVGGVGWRTTARQRHFDNETGRQWDSDWDSEAVMGTARQVVGPAA